MDNEMLRVLQLVQELGEQLSHNQKITSALQNQANALKAQASHNGSGFALRRFNTDLSKEFFDSELERMNAQIVIENQALLHENKQLSVLLKEYEGTMDTIMTKFRNHALAAQQHELTLTRHYEALLLARESQGVSSDLTFSTNTSHSLQRLCVHLRNLLRSMAGESPSPDIDPDYEVYNPYVDPAELFALIDALNEGYPGSEGREDWAIERESEISRLERENQELRTMLGIDNDSLAASGIDMGTELARINAPRNPELSERRRNPGGHSQQGSGDRWDTRPSYWEANGNGNNGGQQIFQPPPSQQHTPGGAPLQRAMEIPGGMRMVQGRRSGIFGGGQQPPRGLVVGTGTGRGAPIPQVNSPLGLWSNQPHSPAPLVPERPWQVPAGPNSDLNR
ncbi:hypothetical protein C8J56DRAFT_919714 [Mycena floridula]|nr:hypothetical protein C8J56DRAFT_919714 [Mycena floridula]